MRHELFDFTKFKVHSHCISCPCCCNSCLRVSANHLQHETEVEGLLSWSGITLFLFLMIYLSIYLSIYILSELSLPFLFERIYRLSSGMGLCKFSRGCLQTSIRRSWTSVLMRVFQMHWIPSRELLPEAGPGGRSRAVQKSTRHVSPIRCI